MISESFIREIAIREQTTELNIRREYLQHLFLSNFYKSRNAKGILFKGGTAIRIVFRSPRFSEDLDFSANSINIRRIEDFIIGTIAEIEREGIGVKIAEAKPTTGGYLSEIIFNLNQRRIGILLQLSKRKSAVELEGETITVNNKYIPPYILNILDRQKMVTEKVQALLTRAKPRDYYDFYFLLRSGLIQNKNKQVFTEVKEKLKTNIDFKKELQEFLPQSHWPMLKQLPAAISRELSRFT